MNWLETILIIIGASLDIFAAMECQGSIINKVNKKQLASVCFLAAIIQLVAVYFGYFVSTLICKLNPESDEALLGEIIVIIIFLGLGIRLIGKAVINERIEEHLVLKIDINKSLKVTLITCIYTILAGIAIGFMGTSLVQIMALIFVFTIISIIAGIYTGYHFGFEQKTKAYIIGAVIFCGAAIRTIGAVFFW